MTKSRTEGAAVIKPSQLRQPEMKELTLENIRHFAESVKRLPLTAGQEHDVGIYLKNNPLCSKLSPLLNDFIKAHEHYNNLSGLTPGETAELRKLAKIRQEFKETHKKGEYDGPRFKRFLENEKNITRFNQSMQWWAKNIETLKRLEIWEEYNSIIIDTTAKERLPESTLTARTHQLSDIKLEWSRHQIFASYSSENIVEFYNNYLVPMEASLFHTLSEENSFPSEVRDYLCYLLFNVREIRKQAAYSMLIRLRSEEFNKDVENDDILHYHMDRINQECGITIKQIGKQPAARKGLTPTIIREFISIINSYVTENPAEKSMQDNMQRLGVCQIPFRWASYGEDTLKKSVLAQDPVITFCANHFSTLLNEAMMQTSLNNELLATDLMASEDFTLWRLKRLLALAKQQAALAEGKIKNTVDKLIADDLNIWHNKLQKLTQATFTKISIETRNKIDSALDHIFSEEATNHSIILQLNDTIMRAYDIDKKLGIETFDPDKDILLAIAARIKLFIEKGASITSSIQDKIVKLLMLSSSEFDDTRMHNLRDQLKSLTEHVRNIHVNDDSYIMHYIVHHIESPIISDVTIETSLKRHQYIARLYNEHGGQSAPVTTINGDGNEKTKLLLQYIQFVFMPLIHQCPTITLNNFDQNHTAAIISQLEIQLIGNKNIDILNTVKDQYEAEIAGKLNNLFAIKKYLFQSDVANLNAEKLQQLVDRVKRFFSRADYKNLIFASIENACKDLVKSHLISAIHSDKEPDMKCIDEINAILGKNIMENMASDPEIARSLLSYVELYNGANNHLGGLLARLALNSAQPDKQDMIYLYASKRLNYISTNHAACRNDYSFFAYYKGKKDVAELLATYREKQQKEISMWLQTSSRWNLQRATLIELFGNYKDVQKYRFMRIRELLSENATANKSDNASEQIFNKFMATINPERVEKNNRLVHLNHTVYDKTTLDAYFNYAINNRPWSLMLEKIIETCGTPEQLQILHFKFVSKQLTNGNDMRTAWLGQKIHELSLAYANTKNNLKDIYSAFFGGSNIHKICAQIERMLTVLAAANVHSGKEPLSLSDYDTHMAIISSLKLLSPLYLSFAKNATYIGMMHSLPDLEKTIVLHQTLHSTIKYQTSLLTVASENATLHNAILLLIKNVMDLEDSRFVTGDNISQYIKFCTEEVLDKINAVLNNKDYPLTFSVLSTLADLLANLPSDNLKLQLTLAHKQEALANPIWLTLINHMDEKQGLQAAINYISHPDFNTTMSDEFNVLLAFSKKLASTKTAIHHLMKLSLLKETGIPVPDKKSIDFDSLLHPPATSDKQLLALWNACLTKLTPDQTNAIPTTSGTRYVVRLAEKVASELLLRVRNDAALLNRFMDSFQRLSNAPKLTSGIDHLSLWASKSESEKLLQPLIAIAHQAVAIRLLQTMDKYILKNVSSDKLALFRKICNDPVYLDTNNTPEKMSTSIRQLMGFKNDSTVLAFAYTVRLYQQASQSLLEKQSLSRLPALIESHQAALNINPALALSKDYKTLLDSLLSISRQNPLVKNDDKFTEKSTWKSYFTLSS